MSTQTSGRVALPLMLVSMVALALEVFLTRLLAYAVHAMLLYVVLGLAMLGFGAAGSLVAVRRGWLDEQRFARVIAWWALAVPPCILGAYAVFVRLSPTLLTFGGMTALAAGLLTLPFLAIGVVVTLALSFSSSSAGRLYAANLFGSGVGCVLPLLFLGALDGEHFLAALAALAWLAACLYVRAAGARPGSRLGLATAATFLLVAAGLFSASSVLAIQPEPFGQAELIRRASVERGIEVHKRWDRWDPTGRIEIFEYEGVPDAPDPYPFLFYAQDATSGSLLVRWDREHASVDDAVPRMCTETLFAQAYGRPRARVLVVGVGGGPDVQCALFHRATRVDAVEINAAAVEAVTGPFDELLGGIGTDPLVSYYVQDGRSFVHAAPEGTYDLIQLSGVDTKHTLVSGALALSENHLYTREAFADYLAALAPGGVVAMLRFGEWEMLRAVNSAVVALRDVGRSRPERHLLVLQNGVLFGILIGRDPITPEDAEAVHGLFEGDDRPFVGLSIFFYELFDFPLRLAPAVVYAPGEGAAPRLDDYFRQVAAKDTSSFEESYEWDISATTDDRPFFFDMTRYDRPAGWQRPHVRMLVTLVLAVVGLAIVLILLPVWSLRSGLRATGAVAVVLFAAIGLGYLFAEVWLLHRFSMFLGHQTYSLGVVLAPLLVATGAGAVLGERIVPTPALRIRIAAAAIVGWLTVGALVLPYVLDAVWTTAPSLRVVVVVCFVAPLGVLLGFPFPAGLRWVSAASRAAVPWCVGVNAFASVVATVVAIPIALGFGYTTVLVAAVLLYAVAAAASLLMARRRDT